MQYFAPGVASGIRAAHEIPEFRRVLTAGPWYACASTQGGKSGALIFQKGDQQPPPHSDRWRECFDGLLYRPDNKRPGTADLVRDDRRMRHLDLTLASGVLISIPVASAAARAVDFGAKKFAAPSDDFGKSAYAFFDRLKEADAARQPKLGDPDTLSLVLLAVQQFYRVTEELLNDLGWISSADIDPIISATMGISDSKTQAAGGSSRSSAAA